MTHEYLSRLPAAVPAGKVLVHNHIVPTRNLGMRGFRVWLSEPDPELVVCKCSWAPELGVHYRVAARAPKAREDGAR